MMLLTMSDNFTGVLQFLTVVIIFVVVLGITFLATRWIANYQKGAAIQAANFELIETFRLTTNKYLQIIRVGEKYLVIAIGKDEVQLLTELSAADIVIKREGQTAVPDFAAILAHFKKTPTGGKKGRDGTLPAPSDTQDNESTTDDYDKTFGE